MQSPKSLGFGNKKRSGVFRMDELLNEIRRDFDVACYPVRVGKLTVEFYRVADPDSLLNDEVLLA